MLRSALAVASTTVIACGGQVATDAPTARAPAVPIANAGPPLRPLPTGCEPRPPYQGEPPWQRWTGVACLGVARAPDDGWVTLRWNELAAYDRDGKLRWRSAIEQHGTKCGAPEGFAVDATGRIALACGYSLLSFAADGAFRWQVWPGGNHDIGPPVVGADGTIYVGVDGTLYSVSPVDGANLWTVGTGFNRWFGSITATPSGDLLFVTTMYALHSDDDGSGYRFYYEYEPPELFVVDRHGTIIRRETRDDSDKTWPAWVDLLGERGGRLPAP